MSITVYIDGWHEQSSTQVKAFLTELYPNLDEDDFADQGYQQDENGRHYEIQTVYQNPFPEMNMSNGNWTDFSKSLGLVTEYGTGALSIEQIPLVIRRCMRFLNSEMRLTQAVRSGSCRGNMIDFGTSTNYLQSKTALFIQILKFAQDNGKGVYWA